MQVRIAIGGDIIFGKGVSQIAQARGLGYFFEPIAPLLRAADWTVLNMEGCISTRGAPMPKEYTFRAPPDLAAHLRLAGVSMVSLGNNHSMDYGATALLDTMDYLWQAGVWWAGAGTNRASAAQPVYVDFGGLRVAVATPDAVLPVLREARANADALVVILHWGDEGTTHPNAKQRRIARQLADAGATLIVGHHPHVVQGYARVGTAHVFYSVGNFIHTPRSKRARQAVLLQATLDKSGVRELKPILLWLEGGRPIPQRGRLSL
jgi:poly-gamma-glutamate synthesis protein (capsule biosynthesis protein)